MCKPDTSNWQPVRSICVAPYECNGKNLNLWIISQVGTSYFLWFAASRCQIFGLYQRPYFTGAEFKTPRYLVLKLHNN